MKTKRRFPIVAVLAVLLAGCGLFQRGERVITGSGRVTSETRAVAGIERVALEGMGEVMVQEGAAEALTIEAEDNILPLITSLVEGGTLRLGFDRATWRDSIRPTEPIRYVLTVHDLRAFDLRGSGSLRANNLHADSLTLNLSGSGDVNIEYLEANRLELRISGTSNVTLAGQVGAVDLEVSGSAQVQAGELDSQTATITISGSGDTVVWVRQDLSVNITGSGTVSYFGDPNISRRDITGAGDINPMGVK